MSLLRPAELGDVLFQIVEGHGHDRGGYAPRAPVTIQGLPEAIDAAGPDELDLWVDRVLTAASLADVLGAA